MALIKKVDVEALFFQALRFGSVGSIAAIIHYSIVIFLVSTCLLHPLIANVIAFSIAFQASYFGHRYFTFKETSTQHKVAFSRLLLVQTFNLIVNESLFYILMSYQLPYQIALMIVLLILPIFTFIANKLWVFA